jgi:hypothetical protein
MERFKSEGYAIVSGYDEVSNIWFGDNRVSNKKHSVYTADRPLFLNDFTRLVVHVSILRSIENELFVDKMRQVILNELEELKQIDVPNKPTFIFSHFLCPHPPYIFNANGSEPTPSKSVWGRFDLKGYRKKAYKEQVRFIGTQIIEIVDILRHRDPRAVIIVQADHGHGDMLEILSYKRPPIKFIDIQYGILSAIYLPPGIRMPENITPVNLFRYLFNALFDAKLEVHPDRVFFTALKKPWVFYEVTNDLKRLMAK